MMFYVVCLLTVLLVLLLLGIVFSGSAGKFLTGFAGTLDKLSHSFSAHSDAPPPGATDTVPGRAPSFRNIAPTGSLLILMDGQSRALCPEAGRSITIGRNPSCDLTANSFCSRRHCTITFQDGGYQLSVSATNTNGTWLKHLNGCEWQLTQDLTGSRGIPLELDSRHIPAYLLLSADDEELAEVVTLIRM